MTSIFSTVLIIAIIVSVSLLVIVINSRYRQKRTNKFLSAFNEAAAEFNLSISKMELLGSRIIGFDDQNKKMLFLVATKKKYDGYLVDLSEIQTCRVKKEYEMNSAVYIWRIGADAFSDRIVLQLDYKNDAPSLRLPFYDKSTDPVEEMQERAEKAKAWQSLLSGALKKNGYKAFDNKKSVKRIQVVY